MLAMGQQDEAERVARESLAIALKALGSSHPWTKEAEGALGTVLVARRRWPDAEPLLLSYYAALESIRDRHEVARLIAAMYAGWGKRQSGGKPRRLQAP